MDCSINLTLTSVGKPNKYELVEFVVGKFKSVIGVGSEDMPAVRDKKEDFVEGWCSKLFEIFEKFKISIEPLYLLAESKSNRLRKT